MNGSTITIRWSEEHSIETPIRTYDDNLLGSRIGVRLREQRCPMCNAVVYTRRHSRCGVCEARLPEEVLFNPEEAERVDLLLKAEQARHKLWLQKYG